MMIEYEVVVTQKRNIAIGDHSTEVTDSISGKFNNWGILRSFIGAIMESFDNAEVEIKVVKSETEKEEVSDGLEF